MATRALPDLVARIRLDSTGVDSALENLVGGFGKANFELAALAAGIGLLVVGGKSAIEISQAHAKAEYNLANAIEHSAKVITPSIAQVKAYHAALAALADAQKGKYVPATHLTELQVMRLQDAEARVAAATGQRRINALRRLAELHVEYGARVHGATTQVGNLAAAEARVAKAAAAMGKTITVAGVNGEEVQASLLRFMQTNRDFISSQDEVRNAYANLVREGVKAKDLSRLLSIALNIQATEGGTLTDAVAKLQAAEIGRNKGLATAVGLTLHAVPANASYADKLKIVAGNIKAVERAYGTAQPKVDALTVSQNHLKTDWELIAEKYGPKLIEDIAGISEEIDKGLPGWLDWAGKIGNVASQLGTLLDKLDLFWPAVHAIQHAFDPAGMPADPNGASAYSQSHAGQPGYAGAAHARPGHGGKAATAGKTAQHHIHVNGPVTMVTPAAHAAVVKAGIRDSDRSVR